MLRRLESELKASTSVNAPTDWGQLNTARALRLQQLRENYNAMLFQQR